MFRRYFLPLSTGQKRKPSGKIAVLIGQRGHEEKELGCVGANWRRRPLKGANKRMKRKEERANEYICSLFNDAVSNSDYIASKD
jgi:hypothetical protein